MRAAHGAVPPLALLRRRAVPRRRRIHALRLPAATGRSAMRATRRHRLQRGRVRPARPLPSARHRAELRLRRGPHGRAVRDKHGRVRQPAVPARRALHQPAARLHLRLSRRPARPTVR